ncbi:MAG: Fe(3+)-hydroxamate ABC transporter permease FhuB [Marinobacter sp.]|uniref:Fe(3+)-hydroxamate ABC transporter permease FhuB n=1 Tax=Marinobacter sp. TaxID=50741 RepID=UPI00299D1E3B|nr:Fe(3+)-hydroxamate ABC transporter permease FhuB [Marinobacter sp.]MDX1754570.1 Fe(3+)-hydroxamate ABC transporter permease FhuB [Marinobacter sp.]
MYASEPPIRPARLPAIALLIWATALVASSQPWLGELSVPAMLSALWAPNTSNFSELVVHYSWAPRLAMAVLIGAGLGLAGAVLQQVLRNPLASPTTLGVESGAQLAIAVATMYLPGILAFSPDLIAVAGGVTGTGLVIALTWRLGFSPVTVILAGMVVSFFLGAVNAAFMLFHGEFLGNLFIWGAGSLVQNDWSQFQSLWPRVALLSIAMILLMRPLQLLQLGADNAKALGASVTALRFLALALVIVLTASVVSRVGVIAFVGLAAPALARLLGARTLQQHLHWSTLFGAGLLLLSDALAQWATAWSAGDLVPTGTATALIGGPILLMALRHLKNDDHMPGQASGPASFNPTRTPLLPVLGVIGLLLAVVVILAMSWSPSLSGWRWTPFSDWPDAWDWRGPRFLAAVTAGLVLGVAGTLIQRLTGNVMASPEMLGISSGAALAMVVLTLLGLNPGRGGQLLAGAAGGALVLALLFLLSRRHRFSGHQLLLGGVAIYVFMDAGIRMALAGGGTEAMKLLNWLSGSTWLVTDLEAIGLAAVALVLVGLTGLSQRVLTILPLGEATTQALGIPVAPARLLILLLAALLTAAATIIIGPLSFVGLMAPHLARMLGQQTVGRQMLIAGLVGAVLLGLADYLARVVLFPNQLPAGILAAIVGGTYFLWGLSRHERG